MTHNEINPLTDPRWGILVERHPLSSVFHTPQWLEALRRTYGYLPIVLTRNNEDEPLTSGLAICQMDSWLTGLRYVSLPFSDHCEPLLHDAEDIHMLLAGLREKAGTRAKYTEVRACYSELFEPAGFHLNAEHCLHLLSLRPAINELFLGLHKDSIQRKIRRADREHVEREQGRSELLLQEFYKLLLMTRRRHGIPPQPLQWFRNLIDCFGPSLTIRVARVNGRAIASILTLKHRTTLVYKYGCSDASFHQMGGMPCLFWEAIQEAKAEEMLELDLGRSEFSNSGLIRFKDHLGATRKALQYWRSSRRHSGRVISGLNTNFAGKVLSHLPDPLFRLAGELFYRHAG